MSNHHFDYGPDPHDDDPPEFNKGWTKAAKEHYAKTGAGVTDRPAPGPDGGPEIRVTGPFTDLVINNETTDAAEVERLREKCKYAELSDDAHAAVRRVLMENDVPMAAFIDDHVGNAIVQRNQARAEAAAAYARGYAAGAAAELQKNIAILRDWAAHYPTDIFPEDGKSADCQSAAFARHLCREIEKDMLERGQTD